MLGCPPSLKLPTLISRCMDDLSLSDIAGPIGLQLTPQSLLNELRDAFPLRPPQLHNTMNDLMFMGGQQSVLQWVQDRLEAE